jgi:hypothetical protein
MTTETFCTPPNSSPQGLGAHSRCKVIPK